MRYGSRQASKALVVSALLGFIFTVGANAKPITADSALNDIASDYLVDVFEAVANEIAFEPYAGEQRGAPGTALASSGNALDKSLLLVHALEDQVADWRLRRGKLNDSGVAELLSDFSTELESDVFDSLSDAQRYEVLADSDLQDLVRDHVWVEIKRSPDEEWLALDPSMPGARIGDAFAKGQRSFTRVPRSLKQHLSISYFVETRSGKKQRVGKLDGSVAELSRHPISLVVRAIPQLEKDQKERKKENDSISANDGSLLGGGLFGNSRVQKPAEDNAQKERENKKVDVTKEDIVATEYRRELHAHGEVVDGIKTTRVELKDDGTQIDREWLEITVKVPGQKQRMIARDLFVATPEESQPAAIRRYSLSVVAGTVNPQVFDGYRQELFSVNLKESRAQLSALESDEKNNATALELIKLEAAQATTPHLINLAFAMESDAMSHKLAQNAGVQVVHDLPRIIISSVETDVTNNKKKTSQTAIDLRLDEVTAIPFSGMPKGAAQLFQRARGMQESALEGHLLAQFVEDQNTVLTTTKVMREAQQQNIGTLLITPDNRDILKQLKNPTAQVLSRVEAALDNKHQVIIPASAPKINNNTHWGWWDVNPETGAFVGVLESGQHQAMAQYTVTLEKIGVNDAMGFVIGALTGSTATMTLYSAKMIEYGQMTEQLIQEVAAGIESLTCVLCPSVEVIVSPIAASASIEATCFGEHGVSLGTGVGLSANISFCETYKAGISCAASLMLGTFEVSGDTSVGSNVNMDLGPLSCDN